MRASRIPLIAVLMSLLALLASACGSDEEGDPVEQQPKVVDSAGSLGEVAKLIAVKLDEEIAPQLSDPADSDSGTSPVLTAADIKKIATESLAGSGYEDTQIEVLNERVSFDYDDLDEAAGAKTYSCADAVDGEGKVALAVVPRYYSVVDEHHWSSAWVTVVGDQEVVFASSYHGEDGGYTAQQVDCPEEELGIDTVGLGDLEGATYTAPSEWRSRASQTLEVVERALGSEGGPKVPGAQLRTVAGLRQMQARLDTAARELDLEVVSVADDEAGTSPACTELEGRTFVSNLDTDPDSPVLWFGIWEPDVNASPRYLMNPEYTDFEDLEEDGYPSFGWSRTTADYNAATLEGQACPLA